MTGSSSSSDDLAKAMKSVLEEKGDLAEVRARLEEQLVSASSDGSDGAGTRVSKPPMPQEVILANNLIRQYLQHVGLHKTSSMLCAESGLPNTPVPHNVLRSTMSSVQQAGDKPLLQSMINNILMDSSSVLHP